VDQLLLSDALLLTRHWERTPPAFVSLARIARWLGAAAAASTGSALSPTREPGAPLEYSTKDEILAFQARVNAMQGR
jgi:hypothetical protein